MKSLIYCIALLLGSLSLQAQELASPGNEKAAAEKIAPLISVGIQLGTDIGGAVPVPFKYLPKTYNPYPHLNLSLGGRVSALLDPSWSVGAEVTYKTLNLNADARVKNQKFQDKENIQYFTGSANMQQRFTIVEFPVYAKYHFRGKNDRVLLGLYNAWTLDGLFRVEPLKGFIGSEADRFDAKMDAKMDEMRFDESLGTWDIGLLCGYERQIFPRLDMGIRFSCGFKDIFKHGNKYFDYSMIHMRGSVVLSYDLARFSVKRS
ncbi:MAG: PorT family protein [Odoribacteraceae bacterium]|jgi:hypothetical protein|nr:PorT family protein [Odoribacteraceae bacterium]